MVSLPAGFDASALVADFSALGVYLIGAYVVILSGQMVFRALGVCK